MRGPQVQAARRRTLEENLTDMTGSRAAEMQARIEFEQRADGRAAERQRLEMELLHARVREQMRQTEERPEVPLPPTRTWVCIPFPFHHTHHAPTMLLGR